MGVYSVYAIFKINLMFSLFVVEPLKAPVNVNVELNGKNSVRVTWEPPEEKSVKGYILGYKVIICKTYIYIYILYRFRKRC